MFDDPEAPASYSLSDLADRASLSPRTIRSWIEQDLLPGPDSRGRGARYDDEHRVRIDVIRRLRDDAGLSLPDIRRLLVGRSREELDALPPHGVAAAQALGHRLATVAPPSSALEYLDTLFGRSGAPGSASSSGEPSPAHPATPTSAPRRARAEHWWRLAVTPDVELHVRALPDPEAQLRFERLADHIRHLLQTGEMP